MCMDHPHNYWAHVAQLESSCMASERFHMMQVWSCMLQLRPNVAKLSLKRIQINSLRKKNERVYDQMYWGTVI